MQVIDSLPSDWKEVEVGELPECFKPVQQFKDLWAEATAATSNAKSFEQHWLRTITEFLRKCYEELHVDPFVEPAETVNDRIYITLRDGYRSIINQYPELDLDAKVIYTNDSEIPFNAVFTTKLELEPLELDHYAPWTVITDSGRELKGPSYSLSVQLKKAGIPSSTYDAQFVLGIRDYPVIVDDFNMSSSDATKFIKKMLDQIMDISLGVK